MSRARPAVIGLATLGLVALLSVAFAPQKAPGAQFQYKVVKGLELDASAEQEALDAAIKEAEARLNAFGDSGWELADTVSGFSIFKRRQ